MQRTIFAGCRELGLDDATRRDLQLRVTGKASLSDMSEREKTAVLAELRQLGFKATGGRRPAAKRADVRLAHVLWRLLHESGAARVGGPAGLNAFIRARFAKSWGAAPIDIDAMTDHGQIADVIDALKDWCRREEIDLDA
ncbi:regulatory protein GemA [Maritimibacter alkaliphilus]|uniref:regulatory protein GemA n=1 Tax=Maritimibacter alkaliphilus TaxID=404236 RepID=UPI0028F6DE4B|nr:regulatory protein GemA [Maritimibacter alkaliphilus]